MSRVGTGRSASPDRLRASTVLRYSEPAACDDLFDRCGVVLSLCVFATTTMAFVLQTIGIILFSPLFFAGFMLYLFVFVFLPLKALFEATDGAHTCFDLVGLLRPGQLRVDKVLPRLHTLCL